MPTRIVYRDQAVWEREFLEVDVPDHIPDDELAEYIDEALELGNYRQFLEPEIQDSVEGIDTIIEIQPE